MGPRVLASLCSQFFLTHALQVNSNKSGCTITSSSGSTTAYQTVSPGWQSIGAIYPYYNCVSDFTLHSSSAAQAQMEADIAASGVGTEKAAATYMMYTEQNGNYACKGRFYYDAALDMYRPPDGWLGCCFAGWESFFYCPGGGGAPGTGGAGGAGGAAAVGDPHLQNVHGERFDLMKPGKHVLINIPRGWSAETSLLRVEADARQLGGHCADMYFQELNVTGSWAEAKQAGGYHYRASQGDVGTPEWVAFGKVGLKVVHGLTNSGLSYLNVYVKHLGRSGYAVGGLLGEDDHEDVIIPPEACAKKMSLIGEGHRNSLASLAVASFE